MDSGRVRALVLIHHKTRLRYSLQSEGDFVIGRSTGNLVFDHDPKLSGKHCLIRAGDQGFAIYDLKSPTGILINGAQLQQGKACVLKAGAKFTVGDQSFHVEKERRHDGRWPGVLGIGGRMPALYASIGALMIMALGLVILWPQHKSRSAQPVTLARGLEAEFNEAILHYQQLGDAIRLRSLDERQSLSLIRQDLLPRFTTVHSHLDTYDAPNSREAKRVDLQRRLAGNFVGQLTAMGYYIETKEPQYAKQIAEYNVKMKTLTDALNAASAQRQPSSRAD